MKVNIKELPLAGIRIEKNTDSGSVAFLYKKLGEQVIDDETSIIAEMFEVSFPCYKESLFTEVVENFDIYWEQGKQSEYAKVQKNLTNYVQKYLDRKAQAKGYDGIVSACTYLNSTNAKFKAEGEAYVAWRDSVWSKFYEILNDALAGNCDIPTENELISELPTINL